MVSWKVAAICVAVSTAVVCLLRRRPKVRPTTVFLAGSMKTPWRAELREMFPPHTGFSFVDPTNPNYATTIDLEPQVRKELCGIQKCDVVMFVFESERPCSIALIELGVALQRHDAKDVLIFVHKDCAFLKDLNWRAKYFGRKIVVGESWTDIAPMLSIMR